LVDKLAVVGTRVRAMRIARGFSQSQFGKMVGISPNHVGVMERGNTVPSIGTVRACAKALHVSVSQLVDEDPQPDEGWLRELLTSARAVPPGKRALLLALVAGNVTALCRIEPTKLEDVSLTDLERARLAMDEVLERSMSQAEDDPRILAIVELLHGQSTTAIEAALLFVKQQR
jgi:transcriptional regulator with XRE-family HTH domain